MDQKVDPKVKVTFMPMNVTHEIEFNETVLHLAQRHDIHIQSVCKGIPSCAECRIQIKDGEHHVPPPSSKELSLIGTAHYIDRSRLSCQLRCFGDLTVDLSEQIEKEGRAAKQPQGRANRKEGEVSHAVKGNIIENYTEDNDKSLAEVVDTGVRPGHDNFYDEPKKNQRNQQRQGGGNQNRNEQGGGGKRNRNRNRNKNRQQNAQGGQQNQGGGQNRSGAQNQGGQNRPHQNHNPNQRSNPQNHKQNQPSTGAGSAPSGAKE